MTYAFRGGLLGAALFFVLLSIILSPSALAQEGGHAGDRAALVALYHATDGPNWVNNANWATDESLSTWHGVIVNGSGRVVKLNLSDNLLNGEIPLQLGSLSNLTVLNLFNNQLTGEMPPELGSLFNLAALDLSYNQLTGVIPTALGSLSNLTSLAVYRNQLNREIPPELGSLSNLTALDLSYNQLTGVIPPELGNLSNLTALNLANNQLTEVISTELGSLSNLTALNLSYNQLTGVIPPELGSLSNLTVLDLSYNQLTGVIPTALGSLSNLQELHLWFNQLTGEIPPDLGNLSNLTSLALFVNQLSGEIPPELGNLSNLVWLDLYDNQLSGKIPSNLSNLQTLRRLDLSINQLTGEILRDIGSLSNIERLRLFDNQLSGEIPPELGSLSKLKELDLGFNQLTSEIPAELGSLSNLKRLALFNNQLSGEIPLELGKLSNLISLSLDRNQLSGEVPAEIGSLSNLRSLYLGENQLGGEILPTLVGLDKLQTLSLYGNQLGGEIPPELGNLSNLIELFLHENQLGGEIPPELGSLSNLKVLFLDRNQLSGEVPPILADLDKLTKLSLHDNQLSGEIPPELGGLSNLVELFLHGNRLSGEIPPELGNLSNLKSLTLHSNQLNGCVPWLLGRNADLRASYDGLSICSRINMREGGKIHVKASFLLLDTDVDSETLRVTGVGEAVNGRVLLDGVAITYEHDGSETTSGGFTYTLSDGGAEATGMVVVDVTPVNDPPVAVTDQVEVEEGGTLLLDVSELLANDTDVDSETLRVPEVGEAVNGRVLLDGVAITYEHDGSETTSGGFTYTLSDGGAEATGMVVVDVTPVNDPPVAVTDRVGMEEGGALLLDVSELLANDTDVDSETLRVTGVGEAVNGRVLLDGVAITYEHDGSETTSGGFTYTLSDGGAEATGVVVVDVTPVNDPPVAVTDRVGVEEGGALLLDVSELLANDTDVDSETLRATEVGEAVNGRVLLDGVAITYEHDGSETTSGGFTYTLSAGGAEATGVVVVDVTPVNDPPVAVTDRVGVEEGDALLLDVSELLANDTDVDSETLRVTGVGGGVNGRVLLEGVAITYEHDGSETTSGGFTYTLSDGSAEATGAVMVDVTPVNDPPVAVTDRVGVEEGGALLLEAARLLANDTDVDSETLRVTGVGEAVNGRALLDGVAITYEHDGSETTAGGFTYTLSDGSAEATGMVMVDVTPVNDPPVAVTDRVGVEEGGALLLEAARLLANDTDVDSETLRVTGVGEAVNGRVLLDGVAITYEHDGSETTAGGFTYTLSDGGAEATGMVVVDVTPVNDPPVAVTDRVGVEEGGALLLDVSELLANDTDVDSETLRVTGVGEAVNGRVLLDGVAITYEHDGSETTSGGFTYTLSDGGAEATGMVVVDVITVSGFPVVFAVGFLIGAILVTVTVMVYVRTVRSRRASQQGNPG